MTLTEFMLHTSRGFFILLAVITVIDFLRYRDKIRFDVALVSFSLASGTFIALLASITGTSLTGLSSLILLAQPYLLLRLVHYFHSVPSFINVGAIVSTVVTWVLLLLLENPRPTAATLIITAHFVLINGYTISIFVRGAFSRVGVVRYRLRFAAVGSVFLVIILVIYGIRITFPSASDSITPLAQFFVILSVSAYYIGFVPPTWLSDMWEYLETRNQKIEPQTPKLLGDYKAKVFISYSRKDEVFVHKLVDSLSKAGADIWIDVEDIPSGMKWSTAIQEGLDTCHIMVVVISPDSMASRNVEDEWQYYMDERKIILPVLCRPAKIHFQLKRIQYIDFYQRPYDMAFERLCGDIKTKTVSYRAI
jgi:hypothetical protein